ncbi:MAG: hypothetical protein ACPL3P_02400 [Anaerolineales bacterium]
MRKSIWILTVLLIFFVSCIGKIPSDLEKNAPTSAIVLTSTPILATETAVPTATPFPDFGRAVSAVFLKDNQPLEVYENPEVNSNPRLQLSPQASGLKTTGKEQWVNNAIWIEIEDLQGGRGWVNSGYLTQTISPNDFCQDPAAKQVLDKLLQAINDQDGNALMNLTSKIHGLHIRYQWQNEEVVIPYSDKLAEIFTSQESYVWGYDRTQNKNVQGSFIEVIVPSIKLVTGDGVKLCNTLEQGIAADWSNGYIEWPPEYINLNYYALYHQAPEEDALNWRTWAFGMEKINEEYYITTLVQYKWGY